MELATIILLALILLVALGILSFACLSWLKTRRLQASIDHLLEMNAEGFGKSLKFEEALAASQQILSDQSSDVEKKLVLVDENVIRMGNLVARFSKQASNQQQY